ncbi:MAG TPA: hypothetical protein VKE73_00880, partial [Myxococcota bacterium]|nr:hypothetical protein [Myxococcota bacterium]
PFHSDSEIGYLSLHHSGLPERPTVLHPELAIPLSLERVILRCLEKDRDKRFQSAAELGQALNAVRAGEPALEARTPAPGPPRVIGATSMWSAKTQPGATQGASLRSVIPLMIALCSVVALATACLFYIFLTRPAAPQPAPAPAPVPGVAAAPPPLPALSRAPALVAPSSSPAPVAPAPQSSSVAAPSASPPPPAAPTRAVPSEPSAPPAPPRPPKLAAQKSAAPPPAPPAAPSLPVLPREGEERYTLVNLHPDKDRLFDVNYQRSGFIPLCTKVRIDTQDKKVVRFTVLDTGQQYEYLHHHVIPDFDANVDRVFGTSCAGSRTAGLTSLDQEGIRQGRALVGMTKEGVILAMGYPPEHATPSTESDDWKYWTGKLSTMHVQFQDGRVSEIKK